MTNDLDIANAKANEQTKYAIRIFNNQGTLLSTYTRFGRSFSIPTNNLPNGIYILNISDRKQISNLHLLINH
jgi:hypothetical protein